MKTPSERGTVELSGGRKGEEEEEEEEKQLVEEEREGKGKLPKCDDNLPKNTSLTPLLYMKNSDHIVLKLNLMS